ncbi:hypothetical protein E2320_017469, partial [Naja naja]
EELMEIEKVHVLVESKGRFKEEVKSKKEGLLSTVTTRETSTVQFVGLQIKVFKAVIVGEVKEQRHLTM